MTEFSLNTEFENLAKARLTDQKQQKQMEEITMVLEKNHDKSAKSSDFSQDDNAIMKKRFT